MMTMLCDPCQSIFCGQRKAVSFDSKGLPPFRHHEGIKHLEDSAGNGCFLCTLLWNQLLPDERIKLQRSIGVTLSVYVNQDVTISPISYNVHLRMGHDDPADERGI